MREVLFKAKRTDTDEWVYGSLLATKDYCCIVDEFDVVHPVKRDTVCRYVNNADKNGVKLFEGDIVRRYEIGVLNSKLYPSLHLGIIDDKTLLIKDYHHAYEEYGTNRVEVIGNVFDNPELLHERTREYIKHYW